VNALLRPAWLGFLQGAVLSVAMNLLTDLDFVSPRGAEVLAIALMCLAAVALLGAMILVEDSDRRSSSSRSAESRRWPLRLLLIAFLLTAAGFVAHGWGATSGR
jgi:heme A synthase